MKIITNQWIQKQFQSRSAITTGPSDVILYQGRNLVIYYDRNSWSFTRLGKIEGATRQNLLSVLGNGDVTVTLSIK